MVIAKYELRNSAYVQYVWLGYEDTLSTLIGRPPLDMTATDDKSWLVGPALINFTLVFVSLGVFVFGFEQGLMLSLLTNEYFRSYYRHPTPAQIGTMIAILEIGALFSSIFAGRVGDKIGRRRTIRYGLAIFVIGGLIQTTSVNIWNLSLGRLILGIAIGFLTTIIPCYQLEISPPDHRGFYACLEFTGNIIGYSLLIWTDYGFLFLESNYLWRIPLFVQCIFGFLLWIGSFIIVETPRWLLDHDHNEEGYIVISDLYADGDLESDEAVSIYRDIKELILINRIDGGERSYSYLFKRYRKRLSVACFAQMFAQLNGINIISYYAPYIFELAGWVGRLAILMTGINSLVYIASTIPPWYLVDTWGRKPLLELGAILMGTPLLVIALSLRANNRYTPMTVVFSVITCNAAFGYSWGPIPWLMLEVFPNLVRLKGAAMSTATNWLCNFIVGEMTPILLDIIKWKTYLIPASSCFLSFFAVRYLFPETKGITLEDMGLVFDDSSSVFSFHLGYNLNRDERERLLLIDERDPPRPVPYAQVARDPRLQANTIQENLITGLVLPEAPSVANSGSQVQGKVINPTQSEVSADSIPQEIEPPLADQIAKFKLERLNKGFFSRFGQKQKKADEETPLLQRN